MPTIRLPNSWRPRGYQLNAWRYLENGGKRAALAWHRRAGKDEIALHWTAVAAHERIGTYWHMLPEASQARKAIWEAVNPHTGKRRIDEAFPRELRETTLNNEMFIRFKCGSTWQVVGSDNFQSLVGAPPIGLACSEWSRANPSAWAYLRPILAENGGWAMFISTFFGRNHFYEMVRRAMGDSQYDDWFGEILSAETTGVFSPEQLKQEREEYLAEYGPDEGDALYRQEYLSDPMASVQGAYFGTELGRAETDGRITSVPYERSAPVFTAWDLGLDDQTAIWFAQVVGRELRVIDYLEANNQDLVWYAARLREKPYEYGGHFLPHDGGNATILGKSAQAQLQDAGLSKVEATPRARNAEEVIAHINTARGLLAKCVFDQTKCETGLNALRNYRREWDDKLKTYKRTPLHDWASHGADAFRCLAVNAAKMEQNRFTPPPRASVNPWAA